MSASFPPPPAGWLSVDQAFSLFRTNCVDLQRDHVERARDSQQHLVDRIVEGGMMPSPTNVWIPSGSFARGTKTRPLDDVDLLLIFDGYDTRIDWTDHGTYHLYSGPLNPLSVLAVDHVVNSTRLLFGLRKHIEKLPHYRRSEVAKSLQVVNVNLASAPWAFDIAPAIPIDLRPGDRVFAIPDGHGEWILTNPPFDANRLSRIDRDHLSLVRPAIRLIKYWNGNLRFGRLNSYYLETLALKVFAASIPMRTVPEYVARFFEAAELYLMEPCPDPKGLGGPLDAKVTILDKRRFLFALRKASGDAARAIEVERMGHAHLANARWRAVFGKEYPLHE